MAYFVYIMASKRNGTFYTGLTEDLARRAYEHRNGLIPGFTRQYGVNRLVWYEQHEDLGEARAREHTIKRWKRPFKLNVIEAMNPEWNDLYETLNQ